MPGDAQIFRCLDWIWIVVQWNQIGLDVADAQFVWIGLGAFSVGLDLDHFNWMQILIHCQVYPYVLLTTLSMGGPTVNLTGAQILT